MVRTEAQKSALFIISYYCIDSINAAKIGIIPETSKKNAQKLIEEKRAVSGARAGGYFLCRMGFLGQRKNVTSRGMVSIDSRVVMNVTSVIIVVSFSYFRQRMVP